MPFHLKRLRLLLQIVLISLNKHASRISSLKPTLMHCSRKVSPINGVA